MCWHDRIISSCPYPFCLLWKSCSEEFLNGSILTDLTWFWNITIHFLQENYLWWNYLPTTLPPFIRTSSASVLVDFSSWYGWRSFLVPCEDVSEFCIFVTKGKKKVKVDCIREPTNRWLTNWQTGCWSGAVWIGYSTDVFPGSVSLARTPRILFSNSCASHRFWCEGIWGKPNHYGQLGIRFLSFKDKFLIHSKFRRFDLLQDDIPSVKTVYWSWGVLTVHVSSLPPGRRDSQALQLRIKLSKKAQDGGALFSALLLTGIYCISENWISFGCICTEPWE